jgi:branched-chain amino acid transport system permease protein
MTKNNNRRYFYWLVLAAIIGVLPFVFRSSAAVSLMSSMGIAIIFALSYNMLLGQTGMLSFGHAVYSGLGAYVAIHALNLIGRGRIWFPVTLLPIIGALGGMFFGILFGYVTTRRAGTTFAMISLGIAEMVAASALMLPDFFGGEAGISTNRAVGGSFLGITYGPQIQVYFLIAVWAVVCAVLMYGLTQTPFGRIANAVRDNPERVEFIGYDPQRVRFIMLVLSAAFAGVAGALSAINYEIVTAENVGPVRSGTVLLATFIGGVGQFFGPIIGAIVITFLEVALSSFTKAWILYFGLIFLAMVLYAPGGIASLIVVHKPLWQAGLTRRMLPSYLLALVCALMLLAGIVGLVEINYFISDSQPGETMSLLGFSFDPRTLPPWLAALVPLGVGILAVRFAARLVRSAWQAATQELAQRTRRIQENNDDAPGGAKLTAEQVL